jgi:hypothetical protein
MRSVRGQGTVEYLAVVLLVAMALGGGTAATASGAGADIAAAVPHQVLRALCIVTGGDCDRDRAPCEIGSSADSSSWSATVAVVRVGHSRLLVVERRSDGKVLVTLTKSPSLGVQTIDGVGARLKRARRRLSIGGGVTASVIAALGHGQTWVLPDERTADAFVAALRAGRNVRAADQDLHQVDVVPEVTASRAAGDRVGGDTTLTATARGTIGERADHLTGRHTYFLEGGAGAVLELSARLDGIRAAAAGSAGATTHIALTTDRTGRWIDLTLAATGELSGNVSLPPTAGPIADALNVPTAGGRRWVVEAHLDLSDADNLAAAQALVARLRAIPPRPSAVSAAAGRLAQRIGERAVVDMRTYALERTSEGFEVHAGDAVGLGAGHEISTETTRLIAATTRGLDGRWRRRADCLKETRT